MHLRLRHGWLHTGLAVVLAMPVVAQSREPSRSAISDSTFAIDPAVTHGVLPNGLQYYVREHKKPEKRAVLILTVKAGSLHEDPDQLGLAHFVEHMAFNGTRHFKKNDLIGKLQSMGMSFGSHLSAFTNFDRTQYQIEVPTDDPQKMQVALQIIEDWAHGITFDSADIEAERGVIVEEWRLRDLGAGGRINNQHLLVLLEGSRYADRKPIGDMQIIRTAKREQLVRFYRDWYRPDLMALTVVGDIDKTKIEKAIRERFAPIPNVSTLRPAPVVTFVPNKAPRISVAVDPEISQIRVNILARDSVIVPRDFALYKQLIAMQFAHGIVNDRLAERALRPGTPFLGAALSGSPVSKDVTFAALGIAVRDTQVVDAMTAVWTEVERAMRYGFLQSELNRVKLSANRNAESAVTDRENITSGKLADAYISHFLGMGTGQSQDAELNLYRRAISEIQLSDLNEQIKVWRMRENMVLTVDVPGKYASAMADSMTMRAVFGQVAGAEIARYTETSGESPIMDSLPTPGRIVSEKKLKAGVTEWTLSNGVRVLLKPTTFKKDEVLLLARSKGGYQTVADKDLIDGMLMNEIVSAGGVGKLSTSDLRKRLSQYVFALQGAVADGMEQMGGSSTVKDLETFMQFMYLGFTSRRYDSVAMTTQLQNIKSSLANRELSPSAAYNDTMVAVLSNHHPRVRPITTEIIDSVNVRRAFELYQQRFANAADFTFILVGSFTLDDIRPLITQYVASLPANDTREETPRLGETPLNGIVRKTVRKGLDAQASTALLFHGNTPYTLESASEITFVQELLRLRLIEKLREELAGVYSVNASSTIQPLYSRYTVSVTFTCDPTRIDEMVAATVAVMDSLRQFGPTENEVVKVREAFLRSREESQNDNSFWATTLYTFDDMNWPFDEISSDKRTKALTGKQLHQMAQKYLTTTNYFRFELLPEE